MRAMTTTETPKPCSARVEPVHRVIATEDEGKRFLDALRDEPGEEGPGELPPTKRAQLSGLGPIIIFNLLK